MKSKKNQKKQQQKTLWVGFFRCFFVFFWVGISAANPGFRRLSRLFFSETELTNIFVENELCEGGRQGPHSWIRTDIKKNMHSCNEGGWNSGIVPRIHRGIGISTIQWSVVYIKCINKFSGQSEINPHETCNIYLFKYCHMLFKQKKKYHLIKHYSMKYEPDFLK